MPAVAALEHLDLRAGLKGGDDIALRAGRVAQVQTDAGIGAHIQRAVAGAAGQILGHHVAGLAVHSYAAPGIALLMDGHPRAGGILAQHLGVQRGRLAQVQAAAANGGIGIRQRGRAGEQQQ